MNLRPVRSAAARRLHRAHAGVLGRVGGRAAHHPAGGEAAADPVPRAPDGLHLEGALLTGVARLAPHCWRAVAWSVCPGVPMERAVSFDLCILVPWVLAGVGEMAAEGSASRGLCFA